MTVRRSGAVSEFWMVTDRVQGQYAALPEGQWWRRSRNAVVPQGTSVNSLAEVCWPSTCWTLAMSAMRLAAKAVPKVQVSANRGL